MEVHNWKEVEVDKEILAHQDKVKKIIAKRRHDNHPEIPQSLRNEYSDLKLEALQLEKRRVDLMCLRAKDDPSSRIMSLQRTLLNTKAELQNIRTQATNKDDSPVLQRELSDLDGAMERLAFRAQYCEQQLEKNKKDKIVTTKINIY